MTTESVLLGLDKNHSVPRIFTGFEAIDKSTGGLRGGNTYLLAGLEKSGKTSLLLNWVSHIIKEKKVTFVSTEMGFGEVIERIAGIRRIEIGMETSHEKSQLNTQLKTNFEFIGVDDLIVEGGISVTQLAGKVEKSIWDGADLVVVDNLTTIGSQQTGSDQTWAKVAVAITKMVNLAKTSEIPIIIVLHVKPSVTFKDAPEGLASIARSDDPLRIFDESLTVIKRPSLSDVYGGGGVLSQLSGSMLLWRPYQKFKISKLKEEGMVILESMRHSESGVEIRVHYEGETGKFTEYLSVEDVTTLFT